MVECKHERLSVKSIFCYSGDMLPKRHVSHTYFLQKNQLGNVRLYGALIFLLVIALGVVFWLPNQIKTPILLDDSATENATSTTNSLNNNAVKQLVDSPWQDAQIAKQRRAAQDILSKLLTFQEKLEAQKVSLWANDEYQQAQQFASKADDFYRLQQFEQAQTQYESSLSKFEAIAAKADGVLESSIVNGYGALAQNNAENSLAHFSLAYAINSQNSDALEGLQRAQVLTEVVGLIAQADADKKQGDFIAAKAKLTKASQLDNKSQEVKSAISDIDKAILDSNFNSAMSTGFAALTANKFAEAIKSFLQATQLKPQNDDAKSAYVSAKNKQTEQKLAALIANAELLERNEDWHLAEQGYQEALAIDNTLVSAKVGQIRTKARAKLNDQLVAAIDTPHRLTSEQVFNEVTHLVQQAKALPATPKLTKQIEVLSKLLNSSRQPVLVLFKSDNQTQVTVKRVANLGNFNSTELSLLPGQYTAVGTREGYRDIRQDFELTANGTNTIITIACVEKVTN